MIKGGVKVPRNTFAMRPTTLVEAEEFTGYYVDVVRELDRKQRYENMIIIMSITYNYKTSYCIISTVIIVGVEMKNMESHYLCLHNSPHNKHYLKTDRNALVML